MSGFYIAMNLFGLDVLSRIVHVGTAITLVGGSLFMAIALVPSLEVLQSEQRSAFVTSVRNLWKRYVHAGIALFLLSGFYNYFRAIPKHEGDGLYHALLGTKMLLAFVIFFLASVMVGRSARFEAWRQDPSKVLRVMIILAALIVAVSGFLKIRG
ncbi:MAG: hypothetical protein L7U72_15435 [Rubripirellula sp.]|nr:hypothetical protein [Rubripirellula sp.]